MAGADSRETGWTLSRWFLSISVALSSIGRMFASQASEVGSIPSRATRFSASLFVGPACVVPHELLLESGYRKYLARPIIFSGVII